MDTTLKHLSYYKTGGDFCEVFIPTSEESLQEKILEFNRKGIKFYVVGRGSNSLIMDVPWEGGVLFLRNLSQIVQIDPLKMICGAGVENSFFSQAVLDKGLSGAEWMNGLPGELGGTIRMNARCYGGEISEIVTKVVAIHKKTAERKEYLSKDKIFKGYKDTVFMTDEWIISSAEFSFQQSLDKEASIKKMANCLEDRQNKGQFDYPSCGCVFKNNYTVGIPSGKLLEAAGAKSFKVGDAHVSSKHANFIFNTKQATSFEILDLSFLMQDAVYALFGVWLEYEMEVLGTVPKNYHERLSLQKKQNPNHNIESLRKSFKL